MSAVTRITTIHKKYKNMTPNLKYKRTKFSEIERADNPGMSNLSDSEKTIYGSVWDIQNFLQWFLHDKKETYVIFPLIVRTIYDLSMLATIQ